MSEDNIYPLQVQARSSRKDTQGERKAIKLPNKKLIISALVLEFFLQRVRAKLIY
jgi:hypothetical protein